MGVIPQGGFMAKKVLREVKFQVPAGKATPAPPVGTALGPLGVPAPQFCQQFNDKTKNLEQGIKVPVVVTVYEDRSYSFIVKSPPAAVLIKKEIALEKGSAVPHRDKVASITRDQLKKIAEIKKEDLNANDIEAGANIIAGTARSMGVEVKG